MYSGQWNPPVDEVIHRNYFLEHVDGYFIECGANNGETCTFFEKYLGWDGAFVEASKYAFKCLAEANHEASLFPFALSDVVGVQQFTDIVSAPRGGGGNGSIRHTEGHAKLLADLGVVTETYEVGTTTYSQFSKTFLPAFTDRVDLLVLDVEGHELEVLSTFPQTAENFLPSVMCVEYPVVGLSSLTSVAESYGYVFDFVSFNNAFFHKRVMPEFERGSWFGETERMPDV